MFKELADRQEEEDVSSHLHVAKIILVPGNDLLYALNLELHGQARRSCGTHLFESSDILSFLQMKSHGSGTLRESAFTCLLHLVIDRVTWYCVVQQEAAARGISAFDVLKEQDHQADDCVPGVQNPPECLLSAGAEFQNLCGCRK